MTLLYNIAIRFYYCIIRFASLFNKKAKLWVNGRAGIFQKIRAKISKEDKIIWFHCASLGEFEQGRVLMEKWRADGKWKILLTFFSPSGYEVKKDYHGADYIFYLPIDTPVNAKKFVEMVNPQLAFFIKYEFWYNYLAELKRHNVPTYLVSGIFRPEQYFFHWYGAWFRKQLNNFSRFFLQNENSKKLLLSIGYNNSVVTGDTRFDRVTAIAENSSRVQLIEKFKRNKKLVVAGSTWQEDEKLLSQLIQSTKGELQRLKLIIVPHEIEEARIYLLIKTFSKFKVIRFSKVVENSISDYNVLIIDNIGMLSSLYYYADIAYVGGGFGKGIHNILEAAVFGNPVIFGPNYDKFDEAKDLIRLKGACQIDSYKNLEQILSILILNEEERLKAGVICKNYVSAKKGASEKIMMEVKQQIPQ